MISADKIVEERKRLNLSQEELAEKLSVSRQAVSKWESSQSTPDLQKIIARNRADFTFCAVPFAYTYMWTGAVRGDQPRMLWEPFTLAMMGQSLRYSCGVRASCALKRRVK